MTRVLLLLLLILLPLRSGGQEGGRSPSEPSLGDETQPKAGEKTSEKEREEETLTLPPLADWDEEDARKLREGELIPGEDLLSETLEDLQLPPPPPVPVPPPEIITPEGGITPPETFPEIIGEEFIDEYFGQRPANFLLDPQELLSRQEFRDRESFLQYHAGDSEVDLYVYLFDARQELPEGVTIDSIFEQYFQGGGPTTLVFYFLGMPERAQLALSPEIKKVVSLDEQQRALRNAIQEAFEKSDPAYQLDNFAVELSIRLYWFEKAMVGNDPSPSIAQVAEDIVETPPAAGGPKKDRLKARLKTMAFCLGLFLGVGALGLLGRWIAERRIRYTFPEVECPSLLGAPHAAGVGAVVSFGSAQLPAAQQRDQVPDYLQRM